MDYEKKYKEALEQAIKELAQSGANSDSTRQIKRLFPELAESEDERIRKYFIWIVKNVLDNIQGLKLSKEQTRELIDNYDGIKVSDMLAWLEKQKEEEGYEAIPVESTLEYKLGFKAGKESEKQKEQEPQWTEEDMKMLERIITTLSLPPVYNTKACELMTTWLKSIQDKFGKPVEQKEPEDKGEISDGYHTFNELYYYRMLYNAAFFNLLPKEWVHKSKRHHDGEECFGGEWFIVMANLPTGQISNHYELKDWDLFQIPEKEIADEWDGHTPQEAAERIHKYLLEKQKELFESGKGLYYYDGENTTYCGYPATEENPYDFAISQQEKQEEQKAAEWSKNDTVFLNEITDFFENKTVRLQHDLDMYAHWLKSLPERFVLQPKPQWTKEDERKFQCIRKILLDNLDKTVCEWTYGDILIWYENKGKYRRINTNSPSVWTEEDDIACQNLMSKLRGDKDSTSDEFEIESCDYGLSWLENLRARLCPQKSDACKPAEKQKPWEWSEEDKERMQSILFSIGYCKDEYPNKKDYTKDIDWLKSLRPQRREEPAKPNIVEELKRYLATTPKEQIKKDWEELSEYGVPDSIEEKPADFDDELRLWAKAKDVLNGKIKDLMDEYMPDGDGDDISVEDIRQCLCKCARKAYAYGRHLSRWKPSEEQMEALEYVIRDYREDSCNATANYLQEILDHLKNM